MKDKFIRGKFIYLFPTIIFAFLSIFWIYIQQFDVESTRDFRQIWGHSYWVLSLYGGIIGVIIAKAWGGYRSLLGKTILVLSAGLFLQSFGQVYSSYYVYSNNVEFPPYPGIGDIGFFGSVIAYIYGVILLSKLSGFNFSIKKVHNKIWAFTIPASMLVIAYFLFLKGYEIDWSNKVQIFLDFGYPLGQAFYVSIAILSLLVSRNVLGGVLKKSIMFLTFALIFQSFSDFIFLSQVLNGTWYVGNINDFMYSISYFVMTISLIQIGRSFYKIQNS